MKNNFTFPSRNGRISLRAFLSLLFLLFVQISGVFAQDPAQYGTPFAGVPDRMDANIYQMNLREYSTTRNIEGARLKLQRIKDLGINVIYLMPIYPLGTLKNPDGSPYSHRDLKGIASDLGDLAKFRQFVDEAHAKGIAVILDWVANQTSWDHPWITQNPSWYKKDASGAIAPPCPAPGFCFNDVAQIDLNVVAAQNAMIDAMRYWVFAGNVDGFRFDWADKAPQAFWQKTITNLRGITSHKLLFLAEGSNEGTTSGCTTCGENQPGFHYASGFDYIFGTNFYWNVMKKVWNSGEPAKNLDGVTTGEYTGASSTQLVARFLSNHDDYNADGSPFSFLSGGRNAAMSAFVVASYHRGVPFIYNGIEVGNTAPLPYPWKNGNINWTQDLTVYTEMQKILAVRNSSTALRRGQPTSFIDPANTNPDVIAFTKTINSEKVVVLVNVRNSTKTFTIPSGMAGTYNNAFVAGGASVSLTAGSTVSLSPYQYLVYTNANVPVVAVTGVSVSPTSVSVKAGLTTQLSSTVAPSNATNQSVTWSSSNTAVATVSATGLVTAVAVGTANITVKTVDGNKTAVSAVMVTPGTSFTVNFFKPSTWGTGVRIYWWSALPTGILADGTWPGVLMTNNGNGWYSYTFTNITSTNIIFNDGSGDVNKTVDLNRGTNGWYLNGVWYNSNPGTPILVTGVTVSPTSATVNINATKQLAATVNPTNAANKIVTWSSSNTAVATVNSTGLVTAVAAGTATITVTTQDGAKTATSIITVPSGPATYFTIQNRWKNTYLYDAGVNVGYGTTVAGNNYKWEKVMVDATNFYLKNLGTGEYMHIENQTGSVQSGAIQLVWWSAQWSQDYVDGTYVRFRNRYQTGNIIHVENQTGSAQYANAQDGWYSAQWKLTPISATARIANEITNDEPGASLEIFPNPSSDGKFTVKVSGLENDLNYSLILHNIQGIAVSEQKIEADKNVNYSLKSGVYIIKLNSEKSSVAKKIVVQ
jgi:uncharacterized protein YjdB